jgi:Fe-S oxidoreductase
VAGYNLNHVVEDGKTNIAKLVVGSEGTLAVTTEATLNIVPLPKVRRLVLVHFSELRAGLEAVPDMLKSGPTAIELIDRMMMDLARNKVEYSRLMNVIEGNPAIVLIVEYSGTTEAELDAGVKKLQQILNRLKHHDPVKVVADPAGQANIWFVRKVGLGILMSVKGDIQPLPFIEDVAVPVQHLADYVDDVIQIVTGAGLEKVAIYAHASAGCLHLRPMINLKNAEGIRQMRQIAEGVVGLVHKYHGTLSGEHGEGLARGEFSEQLFGLELVKAFHEVKAAFDPRGLINPGKIVDVAKMDDQTILRFGADYATPFELTDTVLSFQSDGGYARAVELCNGAGVCRKIGPGVMCPSFIATRDEAHATRGRANTLRSAMMGLLGPEGMTSKEVYGVMDLCLSCKACKSECPSSVDMAKIKSEFLRNYQRKHGTPLRSRVFTHIATLNKLGQPVWPVANLMLRGPAKWIMIGLGIHPKRPLPALARQTFSAWFKRRAARRSQSAQKSGKEVVLFHDTFMEYNHPRIGQAAVRVLEAAGFDVILVEKKQCCGRPAVSKGMLDEARRMAQHNVALLAPYAERGIPIVGCEPSCLAMLVDEYPDLAPGPQAKAIASVTLPIEDFLAREADAGRIALHFKALPRRVLLHGHCNQKALFGTAGTKAALKLMPDCTVDEVETSCCGMAGSFGYETEHYDLSMKLAEMSLAPAVRAAPEGTIVAAPGTSCREQIQHTAGCAPLHPIEVLADALADGVH